MTRTTLWTAAALAAALFACSDDGGGDPAGAGGAAGIAGVGGAGMGGAGVGGAGMGGAGVGGAGMGGTAGMAGTGGAAGMGGMAGMAGTGGAGMDFVPGSGTFSAVFEEIFKGTGCNAPIACHGGLVGMLQMLDKQATYDALVGKPAMGMNLTGMPPHCADSGLTRVVPSDPANSLLMQKLDGLQPCGDKMPPTFDLEPAQIEQVRMWIQNGALND